MTKQEYKNMFGSNLKLLMKEKNITMCELANLSGYDRFNIYKYIWGKKLPNCRAVVNLAIALDVTIDELANFVEAID